MAGKPKILTLNLRQICLLPLSATLVSFYFGWALASLVPLVVFAVLALVSIKYKIGSAGIDSRVLGLNFYQYVFLVKLADSDPHESSPLKSGSKENIRVFTFGLFLLADNGKMRAGFLKRNQVLAKAWM